MFGEIITFDHLKIRDIWLLPGIGGYPLAFHIFDLGAGYRHCDPVKTQDKLDTLESLKQFAGPEHKPPKKVVVHHAYADNWQAYRDACKIMMISRENSLPGVPKTNARIERINQDQLHMLCFTMRLWSMNLLPQF